MGSLLACNTMARAAGARSCATLAGCWPPARGELLLAAAACATALLLAAVPAAADGGAELWTDKLLPKAQPRLSKVRKSARRGCCNLQACNRSLSAFQGARLRALFGALSPRDHMSRVRHTWHRHPAA